LQATLAGTAVAVLPSVRSASAAVPPPLFGSSLCGWATYSPPGETLSEAHARIVNRLGGGSLDVVRFFPRAGATSLGSFREPTCKCYIVEVPRGSTWAQMAAQVAAMPSGTRLVGWHEPEVSGTDAATYQKFLRTLGSVIVDSGRTDVVGCAVLEGSTYHSTRYKYNDGTGSGRPWTYWLPDTLPPGITALGGDIYPHGKDSASADSPSELLDPIVRVVTGHYGGCEFVIGEAGAGRKTWSDAVRANYVNRFTDYIRSHPAIFRRVAWFQTATGSQGPWIVLPNPKTGWPVLPLTIAAVAKSMQGH
jgi:hypothetical protein